MLKSVTMALALIPATLYAGDYRFVSFNDPAIRQKLLPRELIEMDLLLNKKYFTNSSEEWYLGFTLIKYDPFTKYHLTSSASLEVLVGNPGNIKGVIKYGIMTMPGGEVKVEVFDTKKELNESLARLGLDHITWSIK